MDQVNLHCGDCVDVMRSMAEASVDAIVTDPPYHLTNNGGGPSGRGIDNAYSRSRAGASSTGFMGMSWDGGDVAFRTDTWVEAMRVLKPGGHLLAFSGSRTYHRMVVAIEDAGFEIRDQIMWLYGSGFPKSRNLDGEWEGWGTALKPAHEPIVVARKPIVGTVAANVLAYGTGALNIDGCRVPTGGEQPKGSGALESWRAMEGRSDLQAHGENVTPEAGRWPANVIHDGSDEVVAMFPQASGQSGAVTGEEPSSKTNSVYGAFNGRPATRPRGDEGSAARFFYCAKASPEDRHEGLQHPGPQFSKGSTLRDAEKLLPSRKGNFHPTVKPTDLMRYLCRLVTPPGGLVFDPFMGSGSTGKAAVLEGFRFIGIDLDPKHVAIAQARIDYARRQGHQPSLLEAA